jgi:hypothetical protein
MSGAYIEENTRQRERLRALLARLTDQDLTRPLGDGWTVAGFLGHLAFWDYRALLLIKRWKQTGVKPSPADVDVINDGMKPLLLAIPPRKIAEMVMEAATAVDREIEGLNPDLITRIEAQATDFRLNRGHHRGAHINDIEAGISKLA